MSLITSNRAYSNVATAAILRSVAPAYTTESRHTFNTSRCISNALSILHRRASVKSILCLGDINATPRGLNLSMTSSIPVNTRGQSDRNGYALTTPLQALSHFNALNGITFSLKGKRTFKSKLTFV